MAMAQDGSVIIALRQKRHNGYMNERSNINNTNTLISIFRQTCNNFPDTLNELGIARPLVNLLFQAVQSLYYTARLPIRQVGLSGYANAAHQPLCSSGFEVAARGTANEIFL